jgi:putative endonuclease
MTEDQRPKAVGGGTSGFNVKPSAPANPLRKDRRKETGGIGESAAAAYLAERGYAVLERNWRCRTGELDAVALDGATLVVVEVRTRRAGGRFGSAAESVDLRKQRQVRLTAQVYLQQARRDTGRVRFDVIAVTLAADGKVGELKHYIGAF